MPEKTKSDDRGDEDLIAAAERAQLIYINDSEPGIRRKGSPKRFWYVGPKGDKLKKGRTVQRIRALAIRPAWTDVWISPDPNGHIQATGRDARGRKQYRYHPDWAAERDGEKYSSLIAFAEALPRLRNQVDADLRRHGLPFERVVASVVWLLDNTMIRVGNAAYARDNKSFGLTTLRDRHVLDLASRVATSAVVPDCARAGSSTRKKSDEQAPPLGHVLDYYPYYGEQHQRGDKDG